eukprot:CAMPEP_0172468718 /NCGR_PEP_ID=MMETSP1065-20121228/61945_1 /TAXON_ID=265537 /ORGANISM="Amphiprora paludosa, Strain CCMP125" /LENGTH=233 /DNA_ID=CAMNT_0013226169 /DNA_START=26 /DNA_END=723 /DNA_ORIENTATION=-
MPETTPPSTPISNETGNEAEARKRDVFSEWLNGMNIISIHPGHLFLSMAMYSGHAAYRDYRVPLNSLLQDPVTPSSVPVENASNSTPPIEKPTSSQSSRVAASSAPVTTSSATESATAVEATISMRDQHTIARRSFRIATNGTVASFAFCGSIFFYLAGLDSLEKTEREFRKWARPKSLEETSYLDLGIAGVDRSHDDFEATKGMSENEELRYIGNKYFTLSDSDDGTVHRLP